MDFAEDCSPIERHSTHQINFTKKKFNENRELLRNEKKNWCQTKRLYEDIFQLNYEAERSDNDSDRQRIRDLIQKKDAEIIELARKIVELQVEADIRPQACQRELPERNLPILQFIQLQINNINKCLRILNKKIENVKKNAMRNSEKHQQWRFRCKQRSQFKTNQRKNIFKRFRVPRQSDGSTSNDRFFD